MKIIRENFKYVVIENDNIIKIFRNKIDAKYFINSKFYKTQPTLKEIRKAKLKKLNLLFK